MPPMAMTPPYAWASHDQVPFTPLPKPLAECRIGVVTTSYLPHAESPGPASIDLALRPAAAERSQIRHLRTDDPGTFVPLERLDELAVCGRIKAVSDRLYCLPTQFSQRSTIETDTPQVLEWIVEESKHHSYGTGPMT